MQNNYQQFEMEAPAVVEGTYLERQRGLFSLIYPEATENLVPNPTPAFTLTGYNGAVSRDLGVMFRSQAACRVTPNATLTDGAYFGPITTVTGWNTFSLDFMGAPGIPYQIYFASTVPATLGTPTTFIGEGIWRRVEVKLYEAAGTSRRLYFTKNGSASTALFYVDGLQLEAKDHSTTYADGNMMGFVPGQTAYYWTGAYHDSSSIRIADTASGGRIVPLSNYNFKLLGHTGLGMAPANNISFPYARIDGENYQTTRMTGRDFSILGTISGNSYQELMKLKSDLINAFHPNRTATRQPLVLTYQDVNDDGSLSANVYKIQCSYIDGLKGVTTNRYQERLGLNFRMANPDIVLEGTNGAFFPMSNNLVNTAFAAARVGGVWGPLGTGFNSSVYAVAADQANGRIWFVGDFTTANGTTVNRICYWDIKTKAFVAIGGATKGVAGGIAYGITVCPNGDVWVFGDFNTCGGAATKGIARWNNASDTFTAFNLAAAATGFRGGTLNAAGTLYAWGNFLDWNGDAAQDYVTSYTAAGSWVALGTSPYAASEKPRTSECGKVDAGGNLWLGSLGSAAAGHLRKWNGITWSDVASVGLNFGISGIFIDTDGVIYLTGTFTAIGGVSAPGLARYNGSGFFTVTSAGVGAGGNGEAIAKDSNGVMWLKGYLPAYGNSAAIFNNSYIYPSEITTKENAAGGGGIATFGSDIYMGWYSESATTSTMNGFTTATTTEPEGNYPVISISGPTTAGTYCTLLRLENWATGKRLFFNLNIQSGEFVRLVFQPRGLTIISSVFGVISSQPLSGSDSYDFKLLMGDNVLAILFSGTLTGASTGIYWNRVRHSLG